MRRRRAGGGGGAARDPDVLYAEADEVRRAVRLPSDPFVGARWALERIAAPAAWETTTGSPDVTVAVAHTGVTGVAWATRVMPLRVFGADGTGRMSNAIQAYEQAARAGARVVNLSSAGPGASSPERDALAVAADLLFVAAAGNDGADVDAQPSYPCAYDLPNVLCVTAADRADGRPTFANIGARGVDVAAPGTGDRRPDPGRRLGRPAPGSRWRRRTPPGPPRSCCPRAVHAPRRHRHRAHRCGRARAGARGLNASPPPCPRPSRRRSPPS